MKLFQNLGLSLVVLSAFAFTATTQAAITQSGAGATLRFGYHTGPGGGIDANTTHLWRLDESDAPFADSTTITETAIPLNFRGTGVNQLPSILQAPGGEANNVRQIDTNFSSSANANIIRAHAQATDATDNLTQAQFNSFFGATGAFTLDFMMRADFGGNPTTNVRIFSQEGADAGESNTFSVVWLSGTTTLELATGGGTVLLAMPTEGTHAYAASSWYHVGVAYDGNEGVADNTKFYFTLVDGPETELAAATTTANLAGTYMFAGDPLTAISEPGPEWNIGNRPSGNTSFDGQLDEIRISNIARGAGDFIFTSGVALLTGDVNGDNIVNQLDLNVVFGNWLSTGATLAQGDANNDGVINQLDINTITGNWLATGPAGGLMGVTVPEPTSCLMLVMGTFGLVRSRRKRM